MPIPADTVLQLEYNNTDRYNTSIVLLLHYVDTNMYEHNWLLIILIPVIRHTCTCTCTVEPLLMDTPYKEHIRKHPPYKGQFNGPKYRTS